MKIVFKTLQSIDGVIQLSLDGGNSWEPYSVIRIKEDGGISIPDDQDLSLIKIKSDSTTLNNLEVISSISAENSVDISNIESLSTNRQVFNKKKLNYRGSIFDTLSVATIYNLIEENSEYIIYSKNILNDPNTDVIGIDFITEMKKVFKSNIKSWCMARNMLSELEPEYKNAAVDPFTNEKIRISNIQITYETLEHYKEALKNISLLSIAMPSRDDLSGKESPFELLDGASVIYPNLAYRDGKHYDVKYTKQNDDVNVELIECSPPEKDIVFLIFFDDIIVDMKRTMHPELNLNGTTINLKSTTDFVEMSLDNVNRFIYKYDSENSILYSLIATTDNENVPDGLKYGMIVYLNHGGPDGDVPHDVWYSENDDNGVDIYSFNFEFNDNINDYQSYIQIVDTPVTDIWTKPDDSGNRFFYALTSADKKGFRFTKDSSDNISSEPFDLSTIKEYTPVISFIKRDGYSLFKKVVDKTPQIKIDGKEPQGESLLFLDYDGKPSFITISELKSKLGIK